MSRQVEKPISKAAERSMIFSHARRSFAGRAFVQFTVVVAMGLAMQFMTAGACAQTELIGTGSPAIDVPAIQAAVNQGGNVLLKGTFSFTGAGSGSPKRVVTISKNVNLAGALDDNGDLPLIVNGERPFFVSAPGADVTFEGLRFQTPKTAGISIASVGNLRIANCKFNGIVPGQVGTETVGFGIFSNPGPYGSLTIVDNMIDGQATASFGINGIILVGTAQSIEIAGNLIQNTSAHGIDLRNVMGDAHVEANTIMTGRFGRGGGVGRFVNAIRCIGLGNYLIEHNTVDFGFENAAGIRLAGTVKAIVRTNKITGSLVDDATPGPQSAAIQVEGTCSENVILNNTLQGRARVAFSVVHSDFPLDKRDGTGDPQVTSLIGNNHELLTASQSDVEVGPVANQTLVVGGNGTIVDLGVGTIVKGGYRTLSGDRFQSTIGVGDQVSDAEEIWTQDWPEN